jgi:hypothetical protein
VSKRDLLWAFGWYSLALASAVFVFSTPDARSGAGDPSFAM